MATGLESVGIALAVPGVIDVILRGALALWDRIEKYRTMDEILSRQVTDSLSPLKRLRACANSDIVQPSRNGVEHQRRSAVCRA